MIARADVVQLVRLPRFSPSAQAAGDGLEPPRFRRTWTSSDRGGASRRIGVGMNTVWEFEFDHNSPFSLFCAARARGEGEPTLERRAQQGHGPGYCRVRLSKRLPSTS
ncbi:hypothetical protein EDB85DRAFT_1892235, partial [Lactarius pseudohatsudake]